MPTTSTIPAAEAIDLNNLLAAATAGIASRVLTKNSGGSLTLFAFGAGEGLSEHTTPFDALVLTLDGALTLTIGGKAVSAAPGTVVLLPATIPHAVEATVASRMLLMMLREPA
ncbi:MAG: cupin domain-containing protein [Vicinamibacterales bacterium]